MYSPYFINKVGNKKSVVGLGHLLIAKDVDRAQFVEMCYRTSSIMMTTSTGEYHQRVKVAMGVMNSLEFPETSDNLGSLLIWMRDLLSGSPLIIGTLLKDDEINNAQEHEIVWGKSYDGRSIEISGNADAGTLFVEVDGGGDGNLTISSDDLIRLISQREIEISAETVLVEASSQCNLRVKKDGEDPVTIIGYELGVGYSYKDEFENEIEINKEHIKFKGKKYVQEVDGYSMRELMQDFQSALQNLQIVTAMGSQAPLNMTEIIALTNKINQIYE